MTINDIRNEGLTFWNAISLVTDVASVVLPIVPAGASHAIRAAKYADAALTTARALDNVDELADSRELLYRSMKMADDGLPQVGKTARELGARTPEDIITINGTVGPDGGGMSVSPGSPNNLPSHRRPSKYGGTGNDPVWCISSCDLGPDLRYRPDPQNPTRHGFVEPATAMTENHYQQALGQTRSRWERVSE